MAALDPIFGLHAEALVVQRKRMEVLAANIANADTPNYQARDVDFAKILSAAQSPSGTPAVRALSTDTRLNPGHIPIAAHGASATDGGLPYRVPVQPSQDRNTVDVQIEQGKFADAALHYQASLNFADGRVRALLTAITGQ